MRVAMRVTARIIMVMIIFVTVLCLYLVGDGLRDALDPRLRGTEKR